MTDRRLVDRLALLLVLGLSVAAWLDWRERDVARLELERARLVLDAHAISAAGELVGFLAMRGED